MFGYSGKSLWSQLVKDVKKKIFLECLEANKRDYLHVKELRIIL